MLGLNPSLAYVYRNTDVCRILFLFTDLPISNQFGFATPKVHYSDGSLFRKSTIPTNPKPNPKAELNPNPYPNPNFYVDLNPNISTVAHEIYNGLLE